MSRRALVIVAVLCVPAQPAAAAEFTPGWDVSTVWDSNVLNSSTDEDSDFSLQTGPNLRLRESRGDLIYDINYRLLYEGYAQTEGLSGIDSTDQYLSGRGVWRATPTTRIEASDSFAYTSTINALSSDSGLISTVALGRERITNNNAQASITKQMGPLWEIRASAGNRLYDYQNPEQSDTTSTTGMLQVTRAFSRRLVAGVGTQFQRQEFAEVASVPSRGTTVYQGFGVLNYQFSPTWRISVQAGPAYVLPDSLSIDAVSVSSYLAVDPNTCPRRADGTPVFIQFPQSAAQLCQRAFYRSVFNPNVVVAGVADPTTFMDVPFVGNQDVGSSLNYFGTISTEKAWRNWTLSLNYSRSASNSSGLNGSTVLDQFEGLVTWNPSPLWSVRFNTIYSTQTALNEALQREIALTPFVDVIGTSFAVIGIPFEVGTGGSLKNQVDITTIYFTLSGNRRISRRLSLNAGVSYRQQKVGGLVDDEKVNDFEVTVGFTWKFDPIQL
jgi:hypothetical protein